MTACRTEQVPLADGSESRFTVAEPESVVRGGIVVLHEARGVTPAVRHLTASLAQEGWLSVAPHLYHRDGADVLPECGGPEEIRDQVEKLCADLVLADTDAALSWLAGRDVPPDRIGVVGFGLGGSVALIVATRRDLGAAVTVNGIGVLEPLSPSLPALVDAAADLRCPWLGIYGGSDDVPPDDVGVLRDATHAAPMATDLVHFAEDRYCFDADQPAAVEAWMRTLNWFDSHLR